MRVRLLHISLLGLLLGGCAGQPQEAVQEQKNINSAAEVAAFNDNALIADSLSQDQRQLFEGIVKEKLTDYADYVNLISDPLLEASLRKHSVAQALLLFEKGSYVIDTLITSEDHKASVLKAKSFFKHLSKGRFGQVSIQIFDIRIAEKFHASEDKGYEAIFSFNQKRVGSAQVVAKRVKCRLNKTTKLFGEEKIESWEVLLSDME